MARQFGRLAVVGFNLEDDSRLEIDKLRVNFDVKKDDGTTPNTAVISVYNLNPENRGKIKRSKQVILSAGYRDGGDIRRGISFLGKVNRTTSKREGTEWITTTESGDGLEAFDAVTNKTFAAGTGIQAIFKEFVDDVKETGTQALSEIVNFFQRVAPNNKLVKGLTVSGPTIKAAQQLLEDLNFRYSYQDGALTIIEAAGFTNDSAVVISPRTGLIDRIELTDTGIAFKTLLDSEIKPSRRISVQDTDNDGLYVVNSLNHLGDTHQTGPVSWVTKVSQATPIQ